jgi:hypothetical protein
MKKVMVLLLLASLVAVFSTTVAAQEQKTTVTKTAANEKPGALVVDEVKVTAVVKAVDQTKRTVTLLLPGGETKTLTVPKEAVNFPQVKVGDEVKAAYVQSVGIFVHGPNEKADAKEMTTVALAPKGEKPGAYVANTQTITAKVTAIDQKTRVVTLTGPEGNSVTFTAGPDVKRLAEVKQGDTVTVRYTEALAIDVVATGKSAPPATTKKQTPKT